MGRKSEIEKGLDPGMDDYIVNADVAPAELINKIKEYLNNPKVYKPVYKNY